MGKLEEHMKNKGSKTRRWRGSESIGGRDGASCISWENGIDDGDKGKWWLSKRGEANQL
jgi:hypothetical protein